MLWSMARLRGYGLRTRDGEIGAVVTALLDPQEWALRYLVVDSSNWLAAHTVLVPAAALACPDATTRTIAVALASNQVKALPEQIPEPELLSAKSLAGRDVRCDDGACGRVDDVIFDEMGWSLRYVVIDTGGLFPGRKVPLPPEWLQVVGEDEMRATLAAERLRQAPAFDDERTIDRHFEDALYAHYGRPTTA